LAVADAIRSGLSARMLRRASGPNSASACIRPIRKPSSRLGIIPGIAHMQALKAATLPRAR
jgi:hypothetical protein